MIAKINDLKVVASGASGLDKRRCTVPLTVFCEGVSRGRPTLIFRGQVSNQRRDVAGIEGLSCTFKRTLGVTMWSWIKGLLINSVTSSLIRRRQVKAGNYWSQMCTRPNKQMKSNIYYRNRTQFSSMFHQGAPAMYNHLMLLWIYPSRISLQFEKHIDKNLNDYVAGKLTASYHRRILTKWVAIAYRKNLCKIIKTWLFVR